MGITPPVDQSGSCLFLRACRRDSRHMWRRVHDAALCVLDTDAIIHKRSTDGAVEFHPRLRVSRSRRYEIRLCNREIATDLQHLQAGGSSQGELLLLDFQSALCHIYTLAG